LKINHQNEKIEHLKSKKIDEEKCRENKIKRDKIIQNYKEKHWGHKLELLNKADEKMRKGI